MLSQLSVHNYVLIQNIDVELSNQFNVFTGETGAGKSLLVDALNFISGQRSGAHVVGNHDTFARVEAIFIMSDNDPIHDKLHEYGLYEEDHVMIVSREMSQEGRSVCRINQRLVNLSVVKDVLEGILDIHSQHETQYLLDAKNHGLLLDRYAGNGSLYQDYRDEYRQYLKLEKERDAIMNSDINPDEIDFAKFQLKEIEAIQPTVDDYEEIASKLETMIAFEKNKSKWNELEAVFNGRISVMDTLYDGMHIIEGIANEELVQAYKDAYFSLESVYESIQKINNNTQFDEYEFNRYQERMMQYTTLKRKFGSVESALEKQEALQARIKQADNYDEFLEDIEIELKRQKTVCEELALQIRKVRQRAAKELEEQIVIQLNELLLEEAQFEIKISDKELSHDGYDTIQFMVSMNKGMALAPLDKVASGGELSRLMLGLKVIFSQIYGISTLVFDEIDTGVSGRVGLRIGEKMKALSETTQVLSITHLGSVAACAHHHYLIEKSHDDQSSITSIKQIDEKQRIQQIALIMSGNDSDNSLKAAEEIYQLGQQF